MAWLVRDGQVLASLETPDSRSARRRGLLGRDTIDGAMLLSPCRSVHSFGMRFDLDVALIDANGTVVAIKALKRNRLLWPRRCVRSIVEARQGAFARWGVEPGDVVEFRG